MTILEYAVGKSSRNAKACWSRFDTINVPQNITGTSIATALEPHPARKAHPAPYSPLVWMLKAQARPRPRNLPRYLNHSELPTSAYDAHAREQANGGCRQSDCQDKMQPWFRRQGCDCKASPLQSFLGGGDGAFRFADHSAPYWTRQKSGRLQQGLSVQHHVSAC